MELALDKVQYIRDDSWVFNITYIFLSLNFYADSFGKEARSQGKIFYVQVQKLHTVVSSWG